MTLVRLTFLALLAACGGRSRQVCPSETHLADPDGRGERCIADDSTCDAVGDCVSADACCTSTCADASGSGIYACTQQCRAPDCTADSCGEGWLCQEAPNDECTAYCVPDTVDCGDGFVPADPTGTGNFICVHEESACLRPADCPGSADGCCTGYCAEGLEAVWSCAQDCGAEAADARPGDEAGAQEWQCSSDDECVAMNGVGWTCSQDTCGNTYGDCVPPAPECDGDDDCVLAIDTAECCMSCAGAYSLDDVADNDCLVVQAQAEPQGDQAPPEGDPMTCDAQCYAVECPAIECVPPNGASCSEGQCVPVY
jgi:hypothetical protein